MNEDADGFDLEAPASGHERSTEDSEAPTPRSGLRHPSQRRGGAPRRGARREKEAPPAAAAPGLPFPFRPGVLLVLGALVLLVLLSGGLFARTEGWPWEIFRSEDGSLAFRWDGAHVLTLLGAFLTAFFLFSSIAPPTRARGAAVLTVAALGLVTLPILDMLARAALLMGLAAAAVLAREGVRGGTGGRGLLFVTLVLLGATLFFPQGTEGYHALGPDVFGDLVGEGADFGDAILAPDTAVVLASLLLFLTALLSFLGVGGRWSVWVAGMVLLVGVLGPMVLAWQAEGEGETCLAAMRGIVYHLPASMLALTLPAAAGTLDAARP